MHALTWAEPPPLPASSRRSGAPRPRGRAFPAWPSAWGAPAGRRGHGGRRGRPAGRFRSTWPPCQMPPAEWPLASWGHSRLHPMRHSGHRRGGRGRLGSRRLTFRAPRGPEAVSPPGVCARRGPCRSACSGTAQAGGAAAEGGGAGSPAFTSRPCPLPMLFRARDTFPRGRGKRFRIGRALTHPRSRRLPTPSAQPGGLGVRGARGAQPEPRASCPGLNGSFFPRTDPRFGRVF